MSEPPWDGSDVKITDVRAFLTAPEGTTLVVVRVETSEPGLYGVGCATFTQRANAVATTVTDYLAPQLVGRDPAEIVDITTILHLSGYWRFGPVLNNAISGVDMALWDIKGKLAGMPVWQLLGGRARTAVPLYGHASGRDPAEVADEVRALLDAGYGHARCQVAVPGAGTYGAPAAGPTTGAWDPRKYTRTVVGLFEYLRQELGDDVELIHDVHERVAPVDAIGLARELEPYRLFFLEDPVAPEDLNWLRRLREQSSIPIAIGELFTHPAEYRPLLAEGLIDFVRVHLSAIGGITPAWRLATACDLFGVRTAWHGPGDVSPIGHAANLALDLVSPNFGIQEQHPFNAEAEEVFPGVPQPRDGHLWPSDRPGLGVDFDERAAGKYPPTLRRQGDRWKPPRRPDGAVQRP
ncbi:enolase C-terminal domain-like protein [Kribbella sp.]|uniref:enolase C-terminal domain-like protein n=1 Tax=Kribbella sp. TaxID=1871183 RepID=UPI002D3A95F7|nr:enolase C-terminal domain-like protein [Kribbella sp.]HZX03252.1 enolase C-terminal domain-like protein [Kribbella sp.]